MIQVSYTVLRAQIGAGSLGVYYVEGSGVYVVYAASTTYVLAADVMFGTADCADFEATLKPRATLVADASDVEALALVAPALDAKGKTLTKAAGLESRTYGRFGVPGDAFDVPIGTTVKRTYVLPFDVDLVDGTILLTGAAGDIARFTVAPQTTLNAVVDPGNLVPVLAAPINVGDKSITLVAPYLAAFVAAALVDAGLFEVIVTDGVNTDAFGPDAAPGEIRMPLNVTGYDPVTGVVTLGSIRIWSDGAVATQWAGFEHAYATDAMVLVTRSLVPRVELDGVSVLRIGEAAQSAAPIKAGVPIVLEYTRSATATGPTRVRVLFDVMTGQTE